MTKEQYLMISQSLKDLENTFTKGMDEITEKVTRLSNQHVEELKQLTNLIDQTL